MSDLWCPFPVYDLLPTPKFWDLCHLKSDHQGQRGGSSRVRTQHAGGPGFNLQCAHTKRLDHQSIPAQIGTATPWVWPLLLTATERVERPKCGTGLWAPLLLSQRWRREVKRSEKQGAATVTKGQPAGFQAPQGAEPSRPHSPSADSPPQQGKQIQGPPCSCSSP